MLWFTSSFCVFSTSSRRSDLPHFCVVFGFIFRIYTIYQLFRFTCQALRFNKDSWNIVNYIFAYWNVINMFIMFLLKVRMFQMVVAQICPFFLTSPASLLLPPPVRTFLICFWRNFWIYNYVKFVSITVQFNYFLVLLIVKTSILYPIIENLIHFG